MTNKSAFKTPEGEASYLAAYEAILKLWPVHFEELELPGQFGMTHILISGPKDAPPFVLLHGYFATLTMWLNNITDFSKRYRVYAIDVMGQPSRSIPDPYRPIGNIEDYMVWLSATLSDLKINRIFLAGMSFGGWIALNFAKAYPERIKKLVLLSPAAVFQPLVKQFSLRGMIMGLIPTRFTVNSFMGWMGFKATPGDTVTRYILDLFYLGIRHFRLHPKTMRVMPTVFSDDELRSLKVPILLLIGENEVIYDAVKALNRARQFIPDFDGALVPQCNHNMCSSQYMVVDERVLDFLNDH